jgi:hypothetical protein
MSDDAAMERHVRVFDAAGTAKGTASSSATPTVHHRGTITARNADRRITAAVVERKIVLEVVENDGYDGGEWNRARWSDAAAESMREPPTWATFLLYLCLRRVDRDAILGDLAEDFTTRLVPTYGRRAAVFWYWTQVARSVWPIVRPRLVRLVGVGALAKAVQAWWSR